MITALEFLEKRLSMFPCRQSAAEYDNSQASTLNFAICEKFSDSLDQLKRMYYVLSSSGLGLHEIGSLFTVVDKFQNLGRKWQSLHWSLEQIERAFCSFVRISAVLSILYLRRTRVYCNRQTRKIHFCKES
jgi:hypothetical protein